MIRGYVPSNIIPISAGSYRATPKCSPAQKGEKKPLALEGDSANASRERAVAKRRAQTESNRRAVELARKLEREAAWAAKREERRVAKAARKAAIAVAGKRETSGPNAHVAAPEGGWPALVRRHVNRRGTRIALSASMPENARASTGAISDWLAARREPTGDRARWLIDNAPESNR